MCVEHPVQQRDQVQQRLRRVQERPAHLLRQGKESISKYRFVLLTKTLYLHYDSE